MKCALGWSFYQRQWASILLPFLLMLVAALYALLRGRWLRLPLRESLKFFNGCAVMLAYLMFPSSVKAMLVVVDCTWMAPEGGQQAPPR